MKYDHDLALINRHLRDEERKKAPIKNSLCDCSFAFCENCNKYTPVDDINGISECEHCGISFVVDF